MKAGHDMKYVCSVCGYVYDDGREGYPFEALPERWVCPRCGAPRSSFEPETEKNRMAGYTMLLSAGQEFLLLTSGPVILCLN